MLDFILKSFMQEILTDSLQWTGKILFDYYNEVGEWNGQESKTYEWKVLCKSPAYYYESYDLCKIN